MRIALIGLGEVGRCFAEPLSMQAETLQLYDTASTPKQKCLADELQAELYREIGPELGHCAVILSAVTGGAARNVANRIARHAVEGTVLLDLTTASPEIKRAAAGELATAGIKMVDLAIMGAISLKGIATPLTAAGAIDQPPVARALQLLESCGCTIQCLSDARVGDAVALKLLRSVFTKGMEALAVECLVAAEHFGLRQELYTALKDVDDTPLPRFLEMLVSTHVIHAKRRSAEVAEAESQLRSAGLPVRLTPAVRTLFEETAAGLEAAPSMEVPALEEALRQLRGLNHGQSDSPNANEPAENGLSRTT